MLLSDKNISYMIALHFLFLQHNPYTTIHSSLYDTKRKCYHQAIIFIFDLRRLNSFTFDFTIKVNPKQMEQ